MDDGKVQQSAGPQSQSTRTVCGPCGLHCESLLFDTRGEETNSRISRSSILQTSEGSPPAPVNFHERARVDEVAQRVNLRPDCPFRLYTKFTSPVRLRYLQTATTGGTSFRLLRVSHDVTVGRDIIHCVCLWGKFQSPPSGYHLSLSLTEGDPERGFVAHSFSSSIRTKLNQLFFRKKFLNALT